MERPSFARMPVIVGLVVGLFFGCTKEEVIPIALSKEAMPLSGIRMVVSDFADMRADRRRLGIKHSFFGSEDMFQVNDPPGQAVAKALTQHLTRTGWPVEYVVGSAALPSGDVLITGTIVELSLDSVRGWFVTEIVAKSRLAIHARNRANDSVITYTVNGSGTYQVFWFEEQDAQELIKDVLESSFDKFVRATKIDGHGLRFRQPGEPTTSARERSSGSSLPLA